MLFLSVSILKLDVWSKFCCIIVFIIICSHCHGYHLVIVIVVVAVDIPRALQRTESLPE